IAKRLLDYNQRSDDLFPAAGARMLPDRVHRNQGSIDEFIHAMAKIL
ncbi:hypothetical protein B27N_00590, partial [Alcanivorax marinus]|nr:hypothetical protein [Alloalcanivorax marinus]